MHEAHDAYLCIGEKTYVNVKDRRRYSDQHYLKTTDEMYELFKDLPEALENNENFPIRISYRPINSSPVLPKIQTVDNQNVDELLIEEASNGLKEKLDEYVLPIHKNENLESIKKTYQERESKSKKTS